MRKRGGLRSNRDGDDGWSGGVHPICFHIGAKAIYWYGVLGALAFLAASAHWSLLARWKGWSPSRGSDLAIWLVLGGLLGARLNYVAANLQYYLEDPWEMLRIDHGGLIFYGGIVGGFVMVLILSRRWQMPVLELTDFTLTGLPLAHAIGRIGCFLNGCCYGSVARLPWAIWMQGAYRHPTQLYESLANIMIYLLLLRLYLRRPSRGLPTAAYLLAYPPIRFLLEFIRGDERMRAGPLTVAQWISLFLVASGLVVLFRVWRRSGSDSVKAAESPAESRR